MVNTILLGPINLFFHTISSGRKILGSQDAHDSMGKTMKSLRAAKMVQLRYNHFSNTLAPRETLVLQSNTDLGNTIIRKKITWPKRDGKRSRNDKIP